MGSEPRQEVLIKKSQVGLIFVDSDVNVQDYFFLEGVSYKAKQYNVNFKAFSQVQYKRMEVEEIDER